MESTSAAATPATLPRRSFCARWLGVESIVLALAAGHLFVRTALAQWLAAAVLEGDPEGYLWMFMIGWFDAGAALAALWVACGPGRLAVRAAWIAGIAWLSWWPFDKDGTYDDLELKIAGGLDAFTFLLTLAVAGGLRQSRGLRLAGPIAEPTQGRWQFRLADLLLWTFVAALVVVARDWWWQYQGMIYSNEPFGWPIYHAMRCGSFQCAITVAAGTAWLLGQRLRPVWFLAAGAAAATAALLAARGPFADPISIEWPEAMKIYYSVSAGALLATAATLLVLRANGWRLVRE
jgi:hypothetical protein